MSAVTERSSYGAMNPVQITVVHVLIPSEHMTWLGFASRLRPPFRKRKYAGHPNLWLSSERGFASKLQIITIPIAILGQVGWTHLVRCARPTGCI